MSSFPFPDPAQAPDVQLVLAAKALAPVLATATMQVAEIPEAAFFTCAVDALFRMISAETRRRADMVIDDGLRALLEAAVELEVDEDGIDDDPAA